MQKYILYYIYEEITLTCFFLKDMEYKVYLNEEAPVPAATKRRWTQNIIGC